MFVTQSARSLSNTCLGIFYKNANYLTAFCPEVKAAKPVNPHRFIVADERVAVGYGYCPKCPADVGPVAAPVATIAAPLDIADGLFPAVLVPATPVFARL